MDNMNNDNDINKQLLLCILFKVSDRRYQSIYEHIHVICHIIQRCFSYRQFNQAFQLWRLSAAYPNELCARSLSHSQSTNVHYHYIYIYTLSHYYYHSYLFEFVVNDAFQQYINIFIYIEIYIGQMIIIIIIRIYPTSNQFRWLVFVLSLAF